jgi:metal-sulfur cluster biosynthetic enzyme
MGVDRYWRALQEVMDPEFPISVVDMGLIRGIHHSSDGEVLVTMTFTSVSCACMQWIESDIRERLLRLDGVHSVRVEIIWDPPWNANQMTDRGKQTLQSWGVAVS